MTIRDNRTILALILTALAIVVPCAAWYLVGSREAERQVSDITEAAHQAAHDTAERLADQLTVRLNTLRETESRRPFYHYQPFFRDPRGTTLMPSPLAAPPGDPLVQVYFQADGESGRITIPAANVEAQQQVDPQAASQRDSLRYLQRELERGLASILFAVRGESRPQQGGTSSSQNQPVVVGSLKWRTLYVTGQPALIALREITTPEGSLLQGFLISSAGVADLFRASNLPAHFMSGKAINDLQAVVGTGDEPWRVTIDSRDALVGATRQAQDLRRGFLVIFMGGAAIALLCGLGVVWLVWQTERLARQRVQFAASAAHELRTPLAGLRIFSDMLAEGLGDPAKSRDYARRVSDEAGRLGRVVSNVLGFTRLERGTFTMHPAPGDLAAAVRESVERQKAALAALGANIELTTEPALPPVRFDNDALGQIVQNLLDNAEKHTRNAVDRTIRISLASRTNDVELSVCDHGPGVPAHVRKHLFEAFSRGNHADSPAGLGLGLVLVKALAKAQGAGVAYRDNAGGGACFTVTFIE